MRHVVVPGSIAEPTMLRLNSHFLAFSFDILKIRCSVPPVAQPRARGARVHGGGDVTVALPPATSPCTTMLPFFLFCIYLTTNLGSLLLASAAQKKKTKFLASLKVPASACHSPQRECRPQVLSLRPADGPPRPVGRNWPGHEARRPHTGSSTRRPWRSLRRSSAPCRSS